MNTLEQLLAEKHRLEREIFNQNTKQSVLKVLLNSIYGTFANKHSSLMDIDNAMSITMTGQNVAKAGADILQEYAFKHYGVTEKIAKYSDTDSIVGSTIILTNAGSMPIEMLYDNYKDCSKTITFHGHEIINVESKHLKCPTFYSDKKVVNWGGIKNLIRHKVSKKKYKIIAGSKEVIMTEDHGCMVLRDGKLIRISPADININTDKAVILKYNFEHHVVEIDSIECIGSFENEYVYDVEMSDETEHTFFANDILIHNSVYISIEPILNKMDCPLVEDGKIKQEAYDLVSKLDEYVNIEILNWARKELYSIDPRFVFKREVIADVGVFLQKKRYILHVLDLEGVVTDKFKYVGIELVRSTTPKKVKTFIESVIKTSLTTQSCKSANEAYRKGYEDFCKLLPDDIALRTSINNLEKYAEGASLGNFKNATPSHVKGAIAYNTLIKQHNLIDKMELIQSGQKVRKLYCTKNKYGIDAICYTSTLPDEFNLKVDWDKMFDKLITQPVERLYEAIGWSLPAIGKEVQTDLFDLLGL